MDHKKINLAALLENKTCYRLMLRATLVPVSGDRFQPAGFPEIGHVIYRAPRENNQTESVCIMDSPASMANHLEALCHENPLTSDLHEDLEGLPYVQLYTDNGTNEVPSRLVTTSLLEGHRLASNYFIGNKKYKPKLITKEAATEEALIDRLLSEFAMPALGNRTHPMPNDYWNVFKTIYRYDPNSLVHGILFPSLGIKISRVLTVHHEAIGASRVPYSGVKFDKIGKTTSGQPIFAVDEETASEIRATFTIDLSLIRSFGRTIKENGKDKVLGLSEGQKRFLLAFSLWKIWRLLSAPFRFRSNCDLRLRKFALLNTDGTELEPLEISDLGVNIENEINSAEFSGSGEPVTKVYWPSSDLFKPGADENGTANSEAVGSSDDEDQDNA